MSNDLSINISHINKLDENEWNDFLFKSSDSTFFCTTGWWKTYQDVYILQIRNEQQQLMAGVPFRILSVLPLLKRFFKSAWLDSSVVVSDEYDEKVRYHLKKAAFDYLLAYLKKRSVINMTISPKTRSHDGELFKEIFGNVDKCATFVVDLSLDEQAIFKSFSKGRKSAIKKAQKMGVEVKILEGASGFSLLSDYCYLENKLFDNKQNSYSNIYFKSEAYLKKLLSSGNTYVAMAYYEDKPVAGSIIVAHYKSLYYYLGASDIELNRLTNGASLLKYESILYGKKKGCQEFDLGGIPFVELDASDSLYGVYKFKKDFGGERQEFDCNNYTIHPRRYKLIWRLRKFESNPLAQKVYRLLTGGKVI